jgi:hypothetical protein
MLWVHNMMLLLNLLWLGGFHVCTKRSNFPFHSLSDLPYHFPPDLVHFHLAPKQEAVDRATPSMGNVELLLFLGLPTLQRLMNFQQSMTSKSVEPWRAVLHWQSVCHTSIFPALLTRKSAVSDCVSHCCPGQEQGTLSHRSR